MQEQEMVQLRDAEVIAVAVDRLSGLARLSLRQEDGVLRAVEFYGLKAFRSEAMTLQNVVSRVLRSSSGQFSKEVLERWLLWVTSLPDAESWLSEARRREWCAACEAGSLELVVVEPSAGAQIVAASSAEGQKLAVRLRIQIQVPGVWARHSADCSNAFSAVSEA